MQNMTQSKVVTINWYITMPSKRRTSCVYEKDTNYYSPMEVQPDNPLCLRASLWFKILIGTGFFIIILSVLFIYVIHKETLDDNGALKSHFCPQSYSMKPIKDHLLNDSFTIGQIRSRVRQQWMYYSTLRYQNKTRKVILKYSPLFDEESNNCCSSMEHLCEFTTDKNKLYTADAVIFHEKDILNNRIPERNNSEQWWIYNNLVPNEPKPKETRFKSVFNLSATYDFRSDAPILPMYWIDNVKTYSRNDKRVTKDTNGDNEIKVAAYNKNCEENDLFMIKYNTVIQELKENNVTIDWYGNCTHATFKPDCFGLQAQEKCFEIIASHYKFALAFEILNADYVSSSLFIALRNNIIPIVIGNSTKDKYQAISPPNSFIYYCDFRNASELVKELKELNTNDTSFQNYHRWLNHNKGLLKPYNRWYCQICGLLLMFKSKTVTIDDIDLWR